MAIIRKYQILKLIVEEFVKSGKPVGSQFLLDNYDLNCSSATIRNEMFELEEEELIEKPHTSAGRIPSSKGYRYYIEHLRDSEDKENLLKARLNKFIDDNGKVMHTDQIIDECCKIISDMTNTVSARMESDSTRECLNKIELVALNQSTAIVIFITDSGHVENRTINIPSGSKLDELQECISIINKRIAGTNLAQMQNVLESVQLILSEHIKNYEMVYNAFANIFLKFASERVSYYGKNNLLSQNDINDIKKIQKIAQMLENNSIWKSFNNDNEGINVTIGKENKLDDIDDISVVSTKLHISEHNVGQVAVIGPTRMDYCQIIDALNFLANRINELNNKKDDKDGNK